MNKDKKEEEEKSNKIEDKNETKNSNIENSDSKESNQENLPNETIIDLDKISNQTEIKNSDIILSIFEICTFNKKYNYGCSNNTRTFWEKIVEENNLKKIFQNFKSETLRKYWKLIRLAGNNDKFIEIVKYNEKFINNPSFKLLPIINGISSFINSESENKNFEEYFSSNFIKEKKVNNKDENERRSSSSRPKIVKINKKPIEKEESEEEVEPKILKLNELVNQMMKITKYNREQVFRALYGTSGNLKHAYLYLMDEIKYEKYFFYDTDDYIIKNLKSKNYFKDLLENKGEELIKEREKFLGIKE